MDHDGKKRRVIAKPDGKFLLQVDPADKIVFAGADASKSPVNVTLKLKNPEKERLAYKVKCTNNSLFRIRPPIGAVDAGATAEVQVTFLNKEAIPESAKHFFAVFHIKAPKTDEKPRNTWARHKGAANAEKRLNVEFKKDAAAAEANKEEVKNEANEEEKKEVKKEETKEVKKDGKEEVTKEVKKEETKEVKKDGKEEVTKEVKKEETKEVKKDGKKEETKEVKKEETKEVKKEGKKEVKKEEKKEETKEEKVEEKEEEKKDEGGDDKKDGAEGGDKEEGDDKEGDDE